MCNFEMSIMTSYIGSMFHGSGIKVSDKVFGSSLLFYGHGHGRSQLIVGSCPKLGLAVVSSRSWGHLSVLLDCCTIVAVPTSTSPYRVRQFVNHVPGPGIGVHFYE